MNKSLKISFYIYVMLVFFLFVTGVLYLTAPTVMPYHLKAIAVPWMEVAPGIQILLWLLVKVLGLAFIIISMAIALVLFLPFRRSEAWAIRALAVLTLCTVFMTLWGSLYVHVKTGVKTPWTLSVLSLVIALAAVLISLKGAGNQNA